MLIMNSNRIMNHNKNVSIAKILVYCLINTINRSQLFGCCLKNYCYLNFFESFHILLKEQNRYSYTFCFKDFILDWLNSNSNYYQRV